MDEKLFVPYLKELADKYSLAQDVEVELTDGEVIVSCDKGSFRFVYDLAKIKEAEADQVVPLLHWRNKRRYVELKNILKTGMIEDARGIRIHHIVPKDIFNSSLQNILAYETDLVEMITGEKVDRIFADFSSDVYTNCIVSAGRLRVSMELGFSPEGSEPVLLHEIVARTGIASDVVVDTQMQQYPIYLLRGKETEHYNEIDNELYGLDNTQADCIRFILGVLGEPEKIPELQKQGKHLAAVYRAAEKATKVLEYVEAEC
ncbi:MAG: hypothetical protein IJI61_10920 [Oscillospiraceae bacterium]|nr:hypothetical protein [Oscillospiraceae bacterium]